MIKLKNVSKYYYSKGVVATGFSRVNLELNLGEFVAITGESGSGKSTLLNVISGLDTYEEGEMYINGEETSHYIAKDFEEYRRKNIGNIYQNFNLVNSYTVYQNIALALMLNGEKDIKSKVIDLIKKVDLYKYRNTKVSKLSGGQKQRVAIARALAKDVPIIIADEPTGSLDKRSAQSVMRILSELSKDKLVIVVTHNYDQVEPYVTRRIVMHDGRVLEDVKINKTEKIEYKENLKIKNISLFDRVRLGIRNTFNIIPKFLLLLMVFAFITGALMFEYALFKKEEKVAETAGFNNVFNDTDVARVVIKKNDNTSFTPDEIEKIKNISNVKKVIENDLLLDSKRTMTDKNKEIWLNSTVLPISTFEDELDYGRMPENDNEIVVEASPNDYYLSDLRDKVVDKDFYILDEETYEISDHSQLLKIVGIKYNENIITNEKVYVSDSVINTIKNQINQEYSRISVKFQGKKTSEFTIVPSDRVPIGEAYISDGLNYRCPKGECMWTYFDVEVKNIYYSDSKNFIVSKTFNKDNITKYLDITNYNKDDFEYIYDNRIYISYDEYNSLFDKDTYQMSVFVDDVDLIDDTVSLLKNMNIKSLKIKDTLYDMGTTELMRILKTVITIVLVITLFFISYFIIKIILKSRNTYYSIIRMLGGSKGVTTQLLMIELITVANIAYFGFIILEILNHNGVINFSVATDVYDYFVLSDYIILYVIIVGMAYLSSMRYSRKLFKDSVMVAFREEV